MKVCFCKNLEFKDILSLVKKFGPNVEKIMEETGAGIACQTCIETEYKNIDMNLFEAIEKAKKELNL